MRVTKKLLTEGLQHCFSLGNDVGCYISPSEAKKVVANIPFRGRSLEVYYNSLKAVRERGFQNLTDLKNFINFYVLIPLSGLVEFRIIPRSKGHHLGKIILVKDHKTDKKLKK